MTVFYRANYTQLWIKLQSDEVLGLLDSDYLEDYFGADGQITLYHVPSGGRFSVLMVEVPQETPAIPHDVFQGYRLLSELPDGVYEVQCRVRDMLGNYTIVGDFQNPRGDERRLNLGFTVLPGTPLAVGGVRHMRRSLATEHRARGALWVGERTLKARVAERGRAFEVQQTSRSAMQVRQNTRGGEREL